MMTTLKTLIAATVIGLATEIQAQDFDRYFTDNTLRIDYNFAGNANEQHIAVDELKELPGWYG